PTRLIETCIAATIVYVALENIWLLLSRSPPLAADRTDGITAVSLRPSLPPSLSRPLPNPEPRAHNPSPTSHRWLLTFFFGLIHGFGFANVLREMGLPTTGLIRCLLTFNLGVEFGQLVIAICLLPLAYVLHHWKHGRKVAMGISILLALFGA